MAVTAHAAAGLWVASVANLTLLDRREGPAPVPCPESGECRIVTDANAERDSLALALQRKSAEARALQQACRKHKAARRAARQAAREEVRIFSLMIQNLGDLVNARIAELQSERDAATSRAQAAEARVAEVEAQSGPLTEEQAEEIQRLAWRYGEARIDCVRDRGCKCFDALSGLKNYLSSLTRPAEAPGKPAPEAPVPDTLKGCWEELQRMGAEVAQLSAGMNFAPLKVRVKCGCSTSVGEFGKTGAAATLSDWQAAVRWARQIKQGVKTNG